MPVDRRLAEALRRAVAPEHVITNEDTLRELARDALTPTRGFPLFEGIRAEPRVAVRPVDAAEVGAVLRVAREQSVPVTPYGAGTGLMGGALSVKPGIVLDLSAMAAVLEVDPIDRRVRVQAGAVLGAVEQALARQGLELGHDPWTQPLATVGGAIATNSLGYLGGKYGSIGDQVLGLEVVLADGSVVRTRPVTRHATGPDLTRLFIGSEGTLGIITEAVLRAFPAPEQRALVGYQFPSFEAGFGALGAMYEIGLNPALLEYGEEDRSRAPSAPTELYLVFEGFREQVVAERRRAEAICRAHEGTRLRSARPRAFWRDRHLVALRFGEARRAGRRRSERGRAFDYLHVALPLQAVLDFRRQAIATVEELGATVLETGLWTAPQLFSLVMAAPAGDSSGPALLAEALDRLLMLAQDSGGSMEYCHGVGVRLAHLMQRELGPGLALLRTLKEALDPHNLLNPGKLAL